MDDSTLTTTISHLLEREPVPMEQAAVLMESLAGRHRIDTHLIYWWASAPLIV